MSSLDDGLAIDLLSGGDPYQIMSRLVTLAAASTGADRCTLTSLDQNVFRVEASYERDGPPDFIGHEYPISWLARQPLLDQAVTSGSIVIGGSLGDGNDIDPDLAPTLLNVKHTGIVPLAVGDSVGAVLILSRKVDRPFVIRDLEGLQQVGMLAVLALRNARLVEAVHSSQQRGLEALTMMSQHIASSMEPATFFEKMSETVAVLANAERAYFWQLTGDELLALHPWDAVGSEQLGATRMPIPDPDSEDGLAGVLYAGKALTVRPESVATDVLPAPVLALGNIHNLLAVPWRTAAGPLGILMACNSRSTFVQQDEWIMRLAARASALVWQGYDAEHRAERLKAAEMERLAVHAQRMADLDQQKSEFLQLASHELRAPITLVSGYLSMLEDSSLGQLPESAAKVVPVMATRMRQMSHLVERMLNASRMEIRGRDSAPVDIRIDDTAQAVVASQTMDEDALRRITVQSNGPLYVRADPDSVETILTNLVSNALKYSPGMSDIRVVVRHEPGWAIVEVTDRGIGISEHEMTRLFQPFRRLDSALSAGIEGTGLGLYLSRNLALELGGDIEARSVAGTGSTFTLRLPAQPAPRAEHASD
ncbi:MAG TPA: GAF domain-containing sensor histidine kinase [Candidatus Saccharimonadales bacterium]|nr:GAF domain-containing sensor histidine kinase [Candidatus Saccharimonadales bacterium]